ncbi:MDR family MFS transporter [Paenibacillus thermotolerans]|uniref:MDR family MFS transporter n=1 Tax=Paenibacillus thermotolerans TaxID=3027807 RepID=UPI0023683812|nr:MULTISPECIES: MDR family MFS transporter [unclassified Paenibacillus]
MDFQKRMVTAALIVATFLSAIEVTIISAAVPAIVSKLGGFELMSWVYAVYLLSSAVTTPIFGKLSDLYGRKGVFVFGAALFVVGSVLCGMSQTMEQLIAFRTIQGLGAGAVIPVTFTIVGDIFSFEQRAKMQGLFSSVWAVAGIVGPLVGGLFVDYLSWHWIFYINVPFGVLSILMVWIYLKENIEKKKRSIDYGGAVTFAVGMTALLYALLTGGNEYAWDSAVIVGLLIVALAFLAAFVLIQLRHPEPMVPLKLFKNRDLTVSNAASFTTSGILIGLNAYLPMWIQGVLLLGASYSGLALTPMSLGWPIAAMLSGRWMIRFGTRTTALLGLIVVTAGTTALTFIGIATPNWVIIAIMFVTGFGFGLCTTVFTVVVQSSVDWSLRGAATSTNTFLRTLGQTIGIAVLGTLFNHQLGSFAGAKDHIPPDVLAGAIHTIFVSAAVLAVVSFFLTLRLPQRKGGEGMSSAS